MRITNSKSQKQKPNFSAPQPVVCTQAQLDEAIFSSVSVLVQGGTVAKPLRISRPFAAPPHIGDNSFVLVRSWNRNRPPFVIVTGTDSTVFAKSTARVECRGRSTVWASDHAKVRMWAGRLSATDYVRCILCNGTNATIRKYVKCYARHRSQVRCFDEARVRLFNSASAHLMSSSARAVRRSRLARIYPSWMAIQAKMSKD